MNNSVILKGNRYGISIVLNDQTEFSQIVKDLGERLESAGEFFDCTKQLVVSFEGRNLTNEQIDQLLTVIDEKSQLNIQYVLEENSDLEATFYDIIHSEDEASNEQHEVKKEEITSSANTDNSRVEHKLEEGITSKENLTMFYRGTLRSGQALESKESLIVLGDVNPGASVKAGKNVVIIGSLKGNVYAGTNGDQDAFVMALNMNPVQLQIANVITRSQDNKFFSKSNKYAMIARIVSGQIIMENVSKSAIFDMK